MSALVPVAYDFRLGPNPFEKHTGIDCALPAKTSVHIVVYDASGRKIRTLASDIHDPGYYSIQWDGTDGTGRRVASGVYFITFHADGYHKHTKLVLIK